MSGRHPGHWWVAGWKWFHPFPEWCSCRQRTVLLGHMWYVRLKSVPAFSMPLANCTALQVKEVFSDHFMARIWRYKQKKSPFPKFQLIPILCFQVMHDYRCVFHCSHRQLCWIKSLTQDFLWELLSIILKWFQPNSFGKVYFLEEGYEICKKFQLWTFWERPLFNIREYAFKCLPGLSTLGS